MVRVSMHANTGHTCTTTRTVHYKQERREERDSDGETHHRLSIIYSSFVECGAVMTA